LQETFGHVGNFGWLIFYFKRLNQFTTTFFNMQPF